MNDLADPWLKYVAEVHRALACPLRVSRIPHPPRSGDLFEYCAIWEALHYLLAKILDWSDPGAGMLWWYRNGQPTTESPQLALAKQVWGHLDAMDAYAAWAWRSGSNSTACPADAEQELARSTLQTDSTWWRRFLSSGRVREHDPFHGGTNALHLGHSNDVGLAACPERLELSTVLKADPSRRHAIIVISEFGCWLSALDRIEKDLPELHGRSWRIQVFQREVGYLGEYRKSRETGRWFAGHHRFHRVGCT